MCKICSAVNLLRIVNREIKKNYSLKCALKLTVTDLAPDEGSYCPVTFNVRYGTNKLIDVSGATDFMFWCDTTQFKDGYSNQKGIILYIQEANVLADGSVTPDAATAWKPKKGSDGGCYYYEDGKGGWVKQQTNDTDFYLPVNYRGWIKMPLTAFDYCEWNGDSVNDRFYGKQIQAVSFGMGNYKRQSGSVLYFDEIGFFGTFKTAVNNSTPANTSSTASSSGNTSSVAQSTSSAAESTADSEVSSVVSETEDTDTASTESNEDTAVEEKNEETEGGSLLWLWIVIAVAVVLIAAFLCFYFIYVKKKNPDFFKNLFKGKQ